MALPSQDMQPFGSQVTMAEASSFQHLHIDQHFEIISQHFAAVNQKVADDTASLEKSVGHQVTRLQDGITARGHARDSIRREIAGHHKKIAFLHQQERKCNEEDEADRKQIQILQTNLEACKARDPYEKLRAMLPPLQPSSVSAGQSASASASSASRPPHQQHPPGVGPRSLVGLENENIEAAGGEAEKTHEDLDQASERDAATGPRPHKRRRTVDDDATTEREVDFDTIYKNGEPTHLIVEHPKKSRNWYVFECQMHSQRFDSKPLLSAMLHAQGRSHGAKLKAEEAIRELGSRVVNCDPNKARQNNEAFVSKTGRQARRPPPVSEVFSPEPGRLYLGRWGTRSSKTWYAVVVLPHDDLEPVGMIGTLRDTGLLDGTIPACYEVQNHKIIGWEKGYEDDGVAVASRKFPLFWLQSNVQYVFKDGKLQVPAQQCFSWLAANKLRPFHDTGPDGKPVIVPEPVRNFFRVAGSGQAPLTYMDSENAGAGLGEEFENDFEQDSDKDYVDDLDDESDEESDDDSDDGSDKVLSKDLREISRREMRQDLENVETHAELPTQTANSCRAPPQQIEVQSQPGTLPERQAPQEQHPIQLPATQPDRTVQMPQGLCPSSIGNKETPQGHPWVPPSPVQHAPVNPSPKVPSTPQPPGAGVETPTHLSARPESEQAMAKVANSALATFHHHGLSAHQQHAGATRPYPHGLQGAGQLVPGLSFRMPTSNIIPPPPTPPGWPYQAEMAVMGPSQYHGMTYPMPNEMVNGKPMDRSSGPGMSPPWATQDKNRC